MAGTRSTNDTRSTFSLGGASPGSGGGGACTFAAAVARRARGGAGARSLSVSAVVRRLRRARGGAADETSGPGGISLASSTAATTMRERLAGWRREELDPGPAGPSRARLDGVDGADILLYVMNEPLSRDR